MDGLLRQYLPRSLDFDTVTDLQLDAIAAELKNVLAKRLAG